MSDTESRHETDPEPKDGAARPPRSRRSRLWSEWIKPFLMVLVVVASLRSAVADWNDVPSGSMRPTILEGERIFVNKLAYDMKIPFTRVRLAEWDEPSRGDVVVLYSPDLRNSLILPIKRRTRLVKRVIGVPGDVIAMRDGHLYVNGEAAEYQPLAMSERTALGLEGEAEYRAGPATVLVWERIDHETHPVTWTPLQPAIRSFGPDRVPPGKYFVMGDNRDNSRDSRWFGFVDRDLIVGEATTVVVSFEKKSFFDRRGRWDRFFLDLP